MASTARIDELKKKFDENPRRYFAPLANEFRKAGDIEQAIVICEEFLPQQPGHMSGHIVYGQALFEADKLPEARTVFETALGLDRENLIALRHLGDIARGQSDFAGARAWYARVLDADPRNEEIQGLIAAIETETTSPSTAEDTFAPAFVAAPTPIRVAPAAPEQPAAFHLDFEDTQPFGIPVVPLPVPAVTADTPTVAIPAIVFASVEPTPAVAMPAVRAGDERFDGFTMHGIESTPDTASLMPDHSARTEGLESVEFTAPAEPIPETSELDATLDSGVPSFAPPVEQIQTLSGLQGSGGIAHEELHSAVAETRISSAFPALDIEGGLLVPSINDAPTPVVAAYAIPAPPTVEMAAAAPVVLEVPGSVQMDGPEPSHEPVGVVDDAHLDGGSPEVFEIPTELPASVLAAEATLIDAGESPPPDVVEFPDEPEEVEAPPAAHTPFVTETMAELYVAQGFRDQAHAVYSQLLAADPSNERLQGKVAELAPVAVVEDTGPNVRHFFATIAARRPTVPVASSALPSDDDFVVPTPRPEEQYATHDAAGQNDASVATDDVPAVTSESFEMAAEPGDRSDLVDEAESMAPAIERRAAMLTPTGSIDALFGNRQPGTSEDSAASALAQAFSNSIEDLPEITGHPARAASGELSLDSVFRDGPARPPRPSQSFSFDQFFSEGAATGNVPRTSGSHQTQRQIEETTKPGDAPAERTADDIEQFNSWLQGLKQR
ncbi:MAG: tetratricopeptide repeat protein [bacterium]